MSATTVKVNHITEEEEIGSLRRKLAAEGHPDPDDAISKVIKEAEEVWKPFINPESRFDYF